MRWVEQTREHRRGQPRDRKEWVRSRSLVVAALCISGIDAFSDESTYTRYPSYPDYCSTPENIATTRAIPPLRRDGKAGQTRLMHVTTVIRHGARTPLAHHTCWEDYWTNKETGRWDCDLKTYIGTPPPLVIERKEGETVEKRELELFLFEKRYDALQSEDGSVTNILNGTCQLGQLIQKGYDQQLLNGQLLREAYLYDENKPDHDARLILMDAQYEPQDVFFRSDDDQRTLMSGQVLLRGMFGGSGELTFVAQHVADRSQDIVSGIYTNTCPRLVELKEEAYQSKEFQRYNQSDEVRKLRKLTLEHFGKDFDGPLSCLMTTICNDLTLPEVINDFDSDSPPSEFDEEYGNNRFQRLIDYHNMEKVFPYRFNDAAFSKLSIGPLWAEIHANLAVAADKGAEVGSFPAFALFSAHDSTILQLMSSLGPLVFNATDFPPYASMMIIEIHEIAGGFPDRDIFPSDILFRLIYNGRVLTTTIEGCDPHSDLCDWGVLHEMLRNIATTAPDCEPQKTAFGMDVAKNTALLAETPQGMLLLIVALISGLVGSLVTLWIARKNGSRQEAPALERANAEFD